MTRVHQFVSLIATTAATLLLFVVDARPLLAQDINEMLQAAQQSYDATNYEDAEAQLDRVIESVEPKALSDAQARSAVVTAYELRARARYMANKEPGAASDYQRLLRYKPDYDLPTDVSPKLVSFFENVRRDSIGEVALTVAPDDAQILLDGAEVPAGLNVIRMASGSHEIETRRAGFQSTKQTIMVTAGMTFPIDIQMERNAAMLPLVTSPVGVEVIVDGAPRGVTQSSDRTPENAEFARRLGVEATAVSAPFVLADLSLGTRLIEFRRACYKPEQRQVPIDRLTDFMPVAVKLTPAVATLHIDSRTAGARVILDNADVGAVPLTRRDICEGPHTVEVRSPYGRFVSRVDVKAGDEIPITAVLKPAVAIVTVSGAETIRGAGDMREIVANSLAASAGITLFAPPRDITEQLLRRDSLPADWLAFNRLGEPMGEAAKFTPTARRDYSTQISRALDAQGVASVTVEPGAGPQGEVLVSLLATGSSQPDVIVLRPDNAESRARAAQQLAVDFRVSRASIGMLAIDVQGSPGPVVARVDQDGPATRAGITPGEIVVSVGGKPTPNAAALDAALNDAAAGSSVQLDVRGRTGDNRTVPVQLATAVRALGVNDQTLRLNLVLIALRSRLAGAVNTPDEAALRLNVGIAMMRLGDYQGAVENLERVKLGFGTGVANGTVQYLLGNCYNALGAFDKATMAWTVAQATEADITDEGPPVKGLAAAALRAAGNRR